MSNYVIIADSNLDIPKSLRQEFEILDPIPGIIIYPDGHDEYADVDWERHTAKDFYKDLSKKNLTFRTSLPNQMEISSALEKYIAEGNDILAVTVSGGMSGTYNSFLKAAEELVAKYPGRKFKVVDSRRYGPGVSLLCLYASINRKNGMSLEDNFAWLEEKKLCAHQIGMLDDLFFIHRSGRISYMKAFMGSMIGVKPMADFSNETGSPVVLGNARGNKKAFIVIDEFMNKYFSKENQFLLVVNSDREKESVDLVNALKNKYKDTRIIDYTLGQSSGANVGPGLLAVFFLADQPISKNCEDERKTLNEIINKD